MLQLPKQERKEHPPLTPPRSLVSSRLGDPNYTIAQLLAIARAFTAAACLGEEKLE